MATDTNFETFSYNPFSAEAALIGNPKNSYINFIEMMLLPLIIPTVGQKK